MAAPSSSLRLHFVSGPREGERVPLEEGTVSLGRRPGNAIVVADASVSGKHAELRVEGGKVRLVDLGSTNGTRVGGIQVGDAILEVGSTVRFGAVEAKLELAADGQDFGALGGATAAPAPAPEAEEVFLEEEISLEGDDEPAPAARPIPAKKLPAMDLPEPGGLPGAEPTPALESVDAAAIARSEKRSPVALVLVLLLLGGGGFAAWRLLAGGDSTETGDAPAPVPGNLLADGAFEDPDAEPWTSAEAAPVALLVDASSARTGAGGLGAGLEPDEWALSESPAFALSAHRGVELTLAVEALDDVQVRAGLALYDGESADPLTLAWAPARPGAPGFTEQRLAFEVPQGVTRGRVVVGARAGAGGGALSVDDVVVRATDAPQTGTSFEEYELRVLGAPGSTAALLRSGRLLVPSISLSRWRFGAGEGAGGLQGEPSASWTVEAGDAGLTLVPAGLGADGLHPLWMDVLPADDAPFATLGSDGYREHGGSFRREGVTDLLFGEGVNRVRVGFASPARVVATQAAGAVRLRVELSGEPRVEFQLTFRAERQEAARLARAARDAETGGRLGEAIGAWSELLDRFPFEAALVSEAQSTRARLEQQGFDEVEALRREFERARFFALADLYERLREQALGVAARYDGSATAEAATKLAAELAEARAQLGDATEGERAERLDAVRRALAREDQDTFGSALRAALDAASKRP